MSNSIFKSVPQNNEFTIPFELAQDSLVDWLLELPYSGAREACLQIIYALQALNTAAPAAKTHLIFLNTLSDYLGKYIGLLEDSCWDASFPLSEKEQDYAQIVTWSYLALAESFFAVAEKLSDRDEEVFALYMALFALEKAQLHIAATYNDPDHEFWRLAYQIFSRAEKQKLVNLEVNETNLKGITVNMAFAQILMFYICDTRQFRPKEMQAVFNFLATACENLTFYKVTEIQFQTEVLEISYLLAIKTIAYRFNKLLSHLSEKILTREDLFVFDLEQDNPPINSDGKIDNITLTSRYFYPTVVVKNIYQLLQKGDVKSGVLKSLNSELFARLAKTLEPGKKRKYNREKTNKTLLGLIDFDSIISFLYKATKKIHFEKSEPTKKTNIFLVKKKLLTDKFDYPFHLPNAVEPSIRPPPANIWEDSKNAIKLPAKEVIVKKISILDSSAKGYSVYWDECERSKVKIGDIFGIVSDDKKRLEVAFIRRIASKPDNNMAFGCEVLGFRSELVYIDHVDYETHPGTEGELAIFIYGDEKLQLSDSIVYSTSNFKSGDVVYIHRSDKVVLCSLAKKLNSGALVSHVELEY